MTLPVVDATERTPAGHLVMSTSYFNCLVFFLLVSAIVSGVPIKVRVPVVVLSSVD